ncbi:CobW family GTP-binding protein [Magnetovibrio blakemorei]|uniref:ATP-binding protein n=1 Tax=Magnetovibrio blakemorei TaxID=28181 RepID=A0A1E5QAU7_9PROT|nr:GTP-binding protein [Magnetovibrio blakemorei]OEJ69032.1 ATP-binding protein [Magnetovibrio blakemorei]
MADTTEADPLPTAVAVTVLTGFLGSGKTTLLNHLLNDPDLGKVAVLINEFGDVSIDHLLVEKIDENTVLLESGCVCCSVRSDLVEAMRSLIAKRADGRVPAFERLIIETTGLADPAPIVHTLMSDPLIAGQYRLDGLVCMVDGLLGNATLDSQDEAVKQAAIADRIVISKCDLSHPADLKALQARLGDLNPGAPQICAAHGQVAARALIEAGLFDRNFIAHAAHWLNDEKIKNHAHNHGHNHDPGIRTFVLEADGPIDFMAFQDWLETLLATQGANVLRVKGLLNVKDVDRPIAIHGVQHVFHPPAALASWHGLDQRSRLVFITRNLSEQAVRDTFSAHIPGQLVSK